MKPSTLLSLSANNWLINRISWKHLFVLLLIFHIVPIWFFSYFPSQDGVSHIYNAHVLKEYHKHENYIIRNVWKLNLTIFPNWISHISLAGMLYIFPPIMAEKILLTLMIIGIPTSFLYFLNVIHQENAWVFSWLGFIFSYNYLLYMGFYNFTISISFFFLSLGYWWRHKDRIGTNNLIVLYSLLLLTYLSHIVSFGLVLLAISVCHIYLCGCRVISRIRHHRSIRCLFRDLRPLVQFAGYMLPIYFVLATYYLQSLKDHNSGNHKGIKWTWEYFWGVKSIVYFTDWHIPVNQALLGILGLAVVMSLIHRISRKEWIKQSDSFLLISIIFAFMFFRSPWSFGPGGWINDRIHLYVLLMLTPWLIHNGHRILQIGFTLALVVITLLHFGRTVYDHGRLSAEIAEEVSAVDLIEPHTTYTIRSPSWHKSDSLGEVKYVAPFVHTLALYGTVNKDIGHLGNYEANYNYFPVNRFNHSYYNGKADYVIAWAYPETEEFLDLAPTFDLIHSIKNLKLFRRKQPNDLDLSVWSQTNEGHLSIKFDLQGSSSKLADGYQLVTKEHRYTYGRFGWVTQPPHTEFSGNKEIDPLARDYVSGTHDGVFKLNLPNGDYRITSYFCSVDSGEHKVYLIANNQKVIKKLIVPSNKTIIKKTYFANVTDRKLTQIIYTSKERVQRDTDKHNHWIWNGFVVEKIEN